MVNYSLSYCQCDARNYPILLHFIFVVHAMLCFRSADSHRRVQYYVTGFVSLSSMLSVVI